MVTEKDIDDQFGLFTEELQERKLPDASERLAETYTERNSTARSDSRSDRSE
ncbi:hypothetical protein [Paenibacillus sp. NEAU-GSW1]|uniref:hypothetical protein n=1 Tax=Paenibacillus sp. NEAU-GSW1 TaxID=2682486 RepID=UPI001C12C2CD|nr:hypothetical protein [Paenibacillus sp. NEAU-GSW1]